MSPSHPIMNFYETDKAVSEYLLFHYGSEEEVLPYAFGPRDALNYPARCVSECLDVGSLPANARALDLGCAVGRSSFEFARHCKEVIGIDYSQRFADCGSRLVADGEIDFCYVEQGDLVKQATARVPREIDRSRVSFEQGDAMDLRDHLGQFDALLMANLVDRLTDPGKCLDRIPGLLNPGGQLIITTPCTWLEEYTPKENWLGGFERDGENIVTLDGLRERLDKDFEFVETKDLPFLIREHARKFKWSVAQVSLWRRR
jgi:putative 4-mercaptohistidine N1-methyltranferase